MPSNNNKYQANRNDETNDSSKKAAKVAAKGAADYFTGGKGGAVVDKLANTKLGDKALGTVGKALEKQPGFAKTAKKLDDIGALDTADKGLSIIEGDGAAKEDTSSVISKNGNGISSAIGNSSKNVSSILSGLNKNKSSTNESELSNDSNDNYDFSSNFFGNSDNKSLTKKIWGKLSLRTKLIIIGVLFSLFVIFSFILIIIIQMDSDSDISSIIGNGSCIYTVKGFSNGTKTVKKNIDISNLKVRLMECNGSGPVNGEELIDFEKYILGVVYQENGGGSDEGIKTEAVAARSYALSRPAMMGNSGGTNLYQEDGQWILQLRSCTNDQIYCDPDKGCWSNHIGGEGGTVHSGQDTSKKWSRPPISSDSKIRSLVESTKGQILVNSSGYILNTSYKSGDQNKWNTSRLDYKQILLEHYNKIGASDIIQMACSTTTSSSTGDFVSWKQYDSAWASVPIGNSGKTIRNIGCTVTSVAMLIAKSGVSVNIENFNPGTFVQALNNNGGFSSGGALQWYSITKIAPNFQYQGQKYVSGNSKEEKLSELKSLLSSGYYVTAEVKGNTGQHWVAVDSVSGDNINMFDPGSSSTNMWEKYNWKNTSTFAYFKVV